MMQQHALSLRVADVRAPEGAEVIAGQGFFSPLAVEELYTAVASAAPTAQFGIGMVEGSSGLVRRSGNNAELIDAASTSALEVAAGHFFIVMLHNAFPIQVLGAIRWCACVANLFAATGNPLALVVADHPTGAAVLGAIDGRAADRIEDDAEVRARRALVRDLGYLEPGSGRA